MGAFWIAASSGRTQKLFLGLRLQHVAFLAPIYNYTTTNSGWYNPGGKIHPLFKWTLLFWIFLIHFLISRVILIKCNVLGYYKNIFYICFLNSLFSCEHLLRPCWQKKKLRYSDVSMQEFLIDLWEKAITPAIFFLYILIILHLDTMGQKPCSWSPVAVDEIHLSCMDPDMHHVHSSIFPWLPGERDSYLRISSA